MLGRLTTNRMYGYTGNIINRLKRVTTLLIIRGKIMDIKDIKIGNVLGYSNQIEQCEQVVTVIAVCNDDTVLVEYSNEGYDYVPVSDLYVLESE
jgi:hypothetical protein